MTHADPLRLAEAHGLDTRAFTAGGTAVAWYTLAALPDGRWAVQFGAWVQGVGTVDHPWAAFTTRSECLLRFLAAAEDLCTRDVLVLAPVQAAARADLLAALDAHAEETI